MNFRLRTLELKVPPAAVVLLVAGAMWGISLATRPLEMSDLIRVAAAITIALAGVGLCAAGAISFKRARTTVNPMKPETASSLVTGGIYRITRNPMYVGFLLLLIAWAIYLAAVWAFAGPLVFVVYMNRFQIGPEEKTLSAMFGTSYSDYMAQVRRWL